MKVRRASRRRGTASVFSDHLNKNYPMKMEGLKCFKCSERGYLVSKCN